MSASASLRLLASRTLAVEQATESVTTCGEWLAAWVMGERRDKSPEEGQRLARQYRDAQARLAKAQRALG